MCKHYIKTDILPAEKKVPALDTYYWYCFQHDYKSNQAIKNKIIVPPTDCLPPPTADQEPVTTDGHKNNPT